MADYRDGMEYEDIGCGKKCERCGQPANIFKMSIFNTEMICEECTEKEKVHELYGKALNTERAEVLKGNFNFPGIGLPEDLKNKK